MGNALTDGAARRACAPKEAAQLVEVHEATVRLSLRTGRALGERTITGRWLAVVERSPVTGAWRLVAGTAYEERRARPVSCAVVSLDRMGRATRRPRVRNRKHRKGSRK